METKLKVRVVGYYTVNIADPKDCKRCHNANYGDVMVDDICGQCLLEVYNAAQQRVQRTCLQSPDGEHHFEPGESLIICAYCGASR